MHAVEAKQVRVGGDRPEIVDRDDFDVRAAGFMDRAQNVPANAPEPVDRHLHAHELLAPVQNADFVPVD